jgi:RecA/RadA recombinase
MSKMMDKIRKASTIKIADVLENSTFFNNVDETSTDIPAINIALSGSITGGLKSGILTIAGPSRHFKSMYGLIMASAYLKKNKEAVLLFYDSEFGSPKEYFTSVGIDPSRVLHVPVKDLEELKFDLVQQLSNIDRGDKIVIMIDSIGNLASKKEADDAEEGKSVGDMSRAKYLKSLYRIITPYLRIKDIPLIQIAHIYMTQETYAKAVVSGGTGIMLASDQVWIIGRSQDKDGTELAGYNFTIRIEKSRYVREKTAIPLTVKFEGGLSKYTGLLDIAVEGGIVIKPSNGWFSRVDDDGVIEAKKWRRAESDCADFWNSVLASKNFNKYVNETYLVSNGSLVSDDDFDDEKELAE